MFTFEGVEKDPKGFLKTPESENITVISLF
jgi:hypothetical protein